MMLVCKKMALLMPPSEPPSPAYQQTHKSAIFGTRPIVFTGTVQRDRVTSLVASSTDGLLIVGSAVSQPGFGNWTYSLIVQPPGSLERTDVEPDGAVFHVDLAAVDSVGILSDTIGLTLELAIKSNPQLH